jgi:hypothetical protein
MASYGGASLAVSLVEAAVRAAVAAGAPRRTSAAVAAAAVASAMAVGRGGEGGGGGGGAEPSAAVSQRRRKKNLKKKERRKAARARLSASAHDGTEGGATAEEDAPSAYEMSVDVADGMSCTEGSGKSLNVGTRPASCTDSSGGVLNVGTSRGGAATEGERVFADMLGLAIQGDHGDHGGDVSETADVASMLGLSPDGKAQRRKGGGGR